MQPFLQKSPEVPAAKKVSWRDSRDFFRPEAVEAYTTRQSGEPMHTKSRMEALMIVALTITAAGALACLFLGGR